MASSDQGSKEKFTFFWGANDVFSQWYQCSFEIDGIRYNCAEQYMMHQKAVMFGDEEKSAEILEASHPRDQKRMGREVRNFDGNEWNTKCRDVVIEGNYAKFTQNKDLKEKILETTGSLLVEASPRDCIWGIGLGAKNPKALCKSTWRGKNLLGYCLTTVRDRILSESQAGH
ncbi:protein irg-1-like [Tubulanus polymorphus]|uniref:protein irg-1-like n=1 Tax=Tubulanus polymorphus TaxID=672921 RepID=UPI003DA1EB5C